ncbi:hypothetical protein JLK41_03000 [Ectopseudomonas khazarica]|uniref:hypothetical protein n=1 Tax=Ectopseudomonas khazarica TaxID=2502979 RepID=UPI001AEFED47|nr:hypothetical protein [Pseudomonas khazarica]QTS87156.1 hypothetical protein JLK41_03000 [Pseudomonas khazarica]
MSFLLRHFTAVLCAVLAMLLLLAFIAWSGVSVERPRIASTPDYRIPGVLLQERISDADVQLLLERPLFWEGRRPLAREEESSGTALAGIDGLRVLGVIVKAGVPTALIHDGQKVERVRQGGSVSGWRVEAIALQSVSLSASGRSVELQVLSPRNPSIRLEPVQKP